MKKKEIYELLTKDLKDSIVKIDESMKGHTNFKIGGSADVFIVANSIEDIEYIVSFSQKNKIPLTIVGNGSNVLVSDSGIRGITLKIGLKEINVTKKEELAIVEVDSGVMLGTLAQILLKQGVAGFEFAAGTYGGEFKDIVEEVTILNEKGQIQTINNSECNFSYRHTRFTESKEIIIKAKLKLGYGKIQEIKEKMDEYANSRKEKQPLNFPSAGSTFKRGSDFITAKLIDECGLKGYTSGGAQVSTLHAGFVINIGNATAKDVLNVVNHIKQVVLEKTGKEIELEIELLGESIS